MNENRLINLIISEKEDVEEGIPEKNNVSKDKDVKICVIKPSFGCSAEIKGGHVDT